MFAAPNPRMRLYTTVAMYWAVVREILLGKSHQALDMARLELNLASMVGVRHAVAMPQARMGIYLTIRSLIRPGQKVILSPYTIVDVINMVICAGGVPLFADIRRDTCNIDPDEVERLLDEPDVGAVMVTHFYGLACDIERITAMCEARGVPLVEDSAQSLACRTDGRVVGSFGKAAIFSFGLYKNVTSFLGGAVVTDDDDLAARLRQEISPFPEQPRAMLIAKTRQGLVTDLATWPPLFHALTFWIFRFGHLHDIEALNNQLRTDAHPKIKRLIPPEYQARLSSLQARLVNAQLPGVEADIQARIVTARRYAEGLADLPGLLLPPLRTDGSHVYPYYPVQTDDQDRLLRHLMQNCRDIAASHHRNCAGLEIFSEYARPCPNAERNAQTCIFLPTYPSYGRDEVDRTILEIRRFYGMGT